MFAVSGGLRTSAEFAEASAPDLRSCGGAAPVLGRRPGRRYIDLGATHGVGNLGARTPRSSGPSQQQAAELLYLGSGYDVPGPHRSSSRSSSGCFPPRCPGLPLEFGHRGGRGGHQVRPRRDRAPQDRRRDARVPWTHLRGAQRHLAKGVPRAVRAARPGIRPRSVQRCRPPSPAAVDDDGARAARTGPGRRRASTSRPRSSLHAARAGPPTARRAPRRSTRSRPGMGRTGRSVRVRALGSRPGPSRARQIARGRGADRRDRHDARRFELGSGGAITPPSAATRSPVRRESPPWT